MFEFIFRLMFKVRFEVMFHIDAQIDCRFASQVDDVYGVGHGDEEDKQPG